MSRPPSQEPVTPITEAADASPTGRGLSSGSVGTAPNSAEVTIFDDEDFTARLTDVLGEAALRRELSRPEVEALLVLVERYSYLAHETFWTTYLALAPRKLVGEERAGQRTPDPEVPAARERLRARLGELQEASVA